MFSRSLSYRIVALSLVLLTAPFLAACQAQEPKTQETPEATTAPEPEPMPQEGGLYTPEYQPTGNEVAIIKTSRGEITVQLYGEDAPIHVGNFVELAQKGYYNGTKFHRYIDGFVVQGGDPDTKGASSEEVAAEAAKGEGMGRFGVGGPGYTIKGEFDPKTNPRKHEKGALGMARSADPDSAGSQFYFALEALPQLDGGYTVFGQVTAGLEIMQSLRPGDAIESIEISAGNG